MRSGRWPGGCRQRCTRARRLRTTPTSSHMREYAQGVSIDQKEDTPETLRLQEPMAKRRPTSAPPTGGWRKGTDLLRAPTAYWSRLCPQRSSGARLRRFNSRRAGPAWASIGRGRERCCCRCAIQFTHMQVIREVRRPRGTGGARRRQTVAHAQPPPPRHRVGRRDAQPRHVVFAVRRVSRSTSS